MRNPWPFVVLAMYRQHELIPIESDRLRRPLVTSQTLFMFEYNRCTILEVYDLGLRLLTAIVVLRPVRWTPSGGLGRPCKVAPGSVITCGQKRSQRSTAHSSFTLASTPTTWYEPTLLTGRSHTDGSGARVVIHTTSGGN
ncbi:hypothetical protein RRG08_029670 [Elysia crispata]|uniref:Uncharacterized protein n=1 Tax=Elysia crispata TaxID=231223 RepID=A0AAE1BEM3_9GAST|nr:hypothetical protein RRG08_029670 [Elysia crispata]